MRQPKREEHVFGSFGHKLLIMLSLDRIAAEIVKMGESFTPRKLLKVRVFV
jgi:hypothetical protein